MGDRLPGHGGGVADPVAAITTGFSSVLAMLPKQAMGDIPPALNDGFMQRLDRQLVWLVSPGKEANPGWLRSG